MPVKLTDKVYNEGGSPVQGAVAQAVRTNGTTNTVVATDITDTKGVWAFDSAVAGHQADLADPPVGEWYDVRINVGMQYRLRYGAIKAMMSMVYLAQTIVLGATQIFDASAAALRIPVRTSDPTSAGAGHIVFRSDNKQLKISDGTNWLSAGTPGEVITAVSYTVAPGIGQVWCTAAITVTLPSIQDPARGVVTISATAGQVTVAAVAGGIFGGSPNLTTGVVQNGIIVQGESYTYRSDGGNWRAI